jgi:bifunctional N-acetylglucosamine-1-phosphate-uridyltransferase/glucosamine-1-phosphate-acetyltransferase GlmU-like protein
MASHKTLAIIMAGGEGKRMQSTKPKVLHEVAGVPMLHLIIKKVVSIGIKNIYIVCGKHKDAIISCIHSHVIKDDKFEDVMLSYIDQPIPQGTGDAIKCCLPYMSYVDTQSQYDNVLILNGDTPLIDRSLEAFVKCPSPSLMVMNLDNPSGQGRIVTDNESSKFIKIVEEKDANDDEKCITTVNCGVYLVSRPELLSCIPRITNNNKQGEYYLTDICEMLQDKLNLFTVGENDCHELLNVNTKLELDKANIAFIEKWFVQQNLELRTLANADYGKDYLKLLEQLSSSAQETDSQCFNDIYKMVSNNPNYKIYVVEDTNTEKIIPYLIYK